MNTALHNSHIKYLSPSVFAERPWQPMSDRYGFVPTIDIIDMLRREDFAVVRATQSNTRIEGKAPFTKHMVRMRHLSYLDGKPSEEIPEIVIVNSHDGRSSYRFMAGIFRVACSNGLIIQSTDFGSLRVRHVGGEQLASEVMRVSRRIIDHAPLAMERIERWKQIELTFCQQEAFAASVMELKPTVKIDPYRLLTPRRFADQGNDLWTTANRIQESLIRGGLRTRSKNGRRLTTQPVKSVDTDVKLNQAIWTLTERMEGLVNNSVEHRVAA